MDDFSRVREFLGDMHREFSLPANCDLRDDWPFYVRDGYARRDAIAPALRAVAGLAERNGISSDPLLRVLLPYRGNCRDLFGEATLAVERLAHLQKAVMVPEPLTDQQQEAWNYIRDNGPKSGKEICRDLAIPSESTFTRHYVPALKRHGVRNKRGTGYYIPDAEK